MTSAAHARPKFREGQGLGPYRIVRLIGKGGMAEVYKALDTSQGGFVAVKAMKVTLDDDPMYLEMFVEEGRVGLLLDHPNLIKTLKVRAEPPPFIVMEYVSGLDLSRILRHSQKSGERLSYSEAAYIAHGIAAGLAHAHALTDENGKPLNLVNRDVSPQNARVCLDGRVKLFDFGIAHNAQRFSPEIGFVKGKVRYMSPEQLRGHPVDSRSDVFSFGIVLHELLTGRPLFAADQDQFQLNDSISSARILPPSRIAPKTPTELDEICMSCLGQRPEDRVATLSLVLEPLARFAGDPHSCQSNLERYLESTFPREVAQERDDSSRRHARTDMASTATAPTAPETMEPSVEITEAPETVLITPTGVGQQAKTGPSAAPPPPPVRRARWTGLWWVVIAAFAVAGLISFLVTLLVTKGN